MRQKVAALRIVPEAAFGGRHEFRLRDGIAAGKQGDLMAEANQLLGEIRDNAFGPSV
jgi:hypothetical protein